MEQWLRNYNRALYKEDKTWLNFNLENINLFVNDLINNEEYDFLDDTMEPMMNRLINEYWTKDGIPIKWLSRILEWFYDFLKLEHDGITRSLWRQILKNTIDNYDDKAHIKYCLFQKIDENIFDSERQERIWGIIDSKSYRLIDQKVKTPSV